jgi:hypothetical protein
VHQPEYWAIPRLLAKWRSADLFIMLDSAQFDRTSYQHRARMKNVGGRVNNFLTIPYRHIGEPQQIRVLEPDDPGWPEQHWQFVKNWYPGPMARLREVSYWFRRMAERDDSIGNFAWASMTWLAAQAHITTPVVPASALIAPEGGWGARDNWVLNLCQAVRAKTYLSGKSGAQYLDFQAFDRAGISVEIQSYSQPTEELSGLHEYLMEGPEHLAYLTRRT